MEKIIVSKGRKQPKYKMLQRVSGYQKTMKDRKGMLTIAMVTQVADTAIGFVAIDNSDGDAKLVDVFVEPHLRRSGYGIKLLEAAQAELQADIRCVISELDFPTRKFLCRAGFSVTKLMRQYFAVDIDGFQLVKPFRMHKPLEPGNRIARS